VTSLPTSLTTLARPCALALALLVLLVPVGADAQIKGMPGLDASKPIGQAERPAAGAADEGELKAPSFTSAQADRGRLAFLKSCADCHGDRLDNGEFGGAPLTGSYFRDRWAGLTVDSLFGYLSSAMPPNQPGSLSPQTYADITAFLLSRNGSTPGGSELSSSLDAMATMEIGR
jgi:mono/diheme cytochrome c family protein